MSWCAHCSCSTCRVHDVQSLSQNKVSTKYIADCIIKSFCREREFVLSKYATANDSANMVFVMHYVPADFTLSTRDVDSLFGSCRQVGFCIQDSIINPCAITQMCGFCTHFTSGRTQTLSFYFLGPTFFD